jgi:hypothetical protein
MIDASATTKKARYYRLRYGTAGFAKKLVGYTVHGISYRYHEGRLERPDGGDLPRMTSVDPETIRFSTVPEPYLPSRGDDAFVGTLGGHWDRFRKEPEETLLYRSLRARFEEGRRWEETGMYRVSRWAIENGLSAWNGCRSIAELSERCRSLDELFVSMKENGYAERDVGGVRKSNGADRPNADVIRVGEYVVPDEIRIGVGRNGERIRLGGGKHRLTIAKLLDVDEIPAVVIVEHDEYEGGR